MIHLVFLPEVFQGKCLRALVLVQSHISGWRVPSSSRLVYRDKAIVIIIVVGRVKVNGWKLVKKIINNKFHLNCYSNQ